MIRLILVVIGLFILWVLFLSEFSKRQKISVCIAALLMCIVGLWVDQSSQTPRENIILVAEIEDCGVSSKYSYRTNFDIEFCLLNSSLTATAKRLAMSFIALNCVDGNCQELQIINKDVSLSLEPETQITLKENLSFDKVGVSLESVVWVVKVNSVKALN